MIWMMSITLTSPYRIKCKQRAYKSREGTLVNYFDLNNAWTGRSNEKMLPLSVLLKAETSQGLFEKACKSWLKWLDWIQDLYIAQKWRTCSVPNLARQKGDVTRKCWSAFVLIWFPKQENYHYTLCFLLHDQHQKAAIEFLMGSNITSKGRRMRESFTRLN